MTSHPAAGSNLTHILPALHHALSGSTGTLISTCTLYPLSLVIARLQVQRQLQQRPREGSPLNSAASPSPPEAPRSVAPAATPQLSSPNIHPNVPSQGHQQPAVEEETEGDHQHQQHQQQRGDPEGQGVEAAVAVAEEAKPEGEEEQQQHQDPQDQKEDPSEPLIDLTSQPTTEALTTPPPSTPPPEQQRGGPPPPARAAATETAYTGIIDAFSRIYSEEGGLKALYSGLSQDAAKSLLDSFLFFMFYEWFRGSLRARRSRAKKSLSVLEDLAVGVAAGACSRAFTTPIANVVTRKQTASMVDGEAASSQMSFSQLLGEIRRERGLRGLWSGYSATLLLTLNPSLTFFLQDFLKRTVVPSERWDDPGPKMTFLLAATSKAAASAITYPLQIAKTRLQSGVPTKQHDNEPNGDAVKPDGLEKTEKGADAGKLRAIRALKQIANKSIFGTIAQIVRTEGVGALYDGIQGELIKGFFSHGTTMVTKDVIHKLLFKLYLFTASIMAEWRARAAAAKARRGGGRGGGSGSGGGVGGTGWSGAGLGAITKAALARLHPAQKKSSARDMTIRHQALSPASIGTNRGVEAQGLPVSLQYRLPWNQTTASASRGLGPDYRTQVVNLVDRAQRIVDEN